MDDRRFGIPPFLLNPLKLQILSSLVITNQNRPKSNRVTRLIQGYGTHSFKSNFESWPSGSTPSAPELKLKQQDVGLGLKGLAKSSIGTEQIPPLLEENGKIEVWQINCSAKTPVPKEDIGKFYGEDCYIVLYTYMCYWIGKDSIKVQH
ncbi:hypothetical protein L1987_75940 [Smallanthus sonchifolius]|uniref:Uncharacterized protein n=1 Tax=Smallanthus sonchifolius TaxID=185202 RepID=A0ACB9A7U4_9ASTR|nr:hypothetical protein L1987_75940 [Smallanthus sonchifolius]